MKRLCFLFMVLFATEAAAEQFYTAHNIWLHKGRTGSCINYKKGTLLPAGTAVEKVDVCTDRDGRGNIFSPFISFHRPGDSRRYVVTFNQRWHPEQTVQDCADRLFGTQPFTQLVGGMSIDEQAAVQRGAVLRGMSKDEVLVSYGPPPAHRTPDLSSNIWHYWKNKVKKKKVCFDANGLAIQCSEALADDL